MKKKLKHMIAAKIRILVAEQHELIREMAITPKDTLIYEAIELKMRFIELKIEILMAFLPPLQGPPKF